MTGPGAGPANPEFTLVDHHGNEVTEQNFAGRWVLVFFGFTHCRMVCPRALGRLSGILDTLGGLAEQIQPLYITVDPERDTPEVMRAFLEASYPRFLGLTGTREQIDAAKHAFHVFARRRVDPEDPDGYAVPHTAFTYLLEPSGRVATHWTDTAASETVLAELRAMLTGPATVTAGPEPGRS